MQKVQTEQTGCNCHPRPTSVELPTITYQRLKDAAADRGVSFLGYVDQVCKTAIHNKANISGVRINMELGARSMKTALLQRLTQEDTFKIKVGAVKTIIDSALEQVIENIERPLPPDRLHEDVQNPDEYDEKYPSRGDA